MTGITKKAGINIADCLVASAHLMYNRKTAHRYLTAVIERIKERMKEFPQTENKGEIN